MKFERIVFALIIIASLACVAYADMQFSGYSVSPSTLKPGVSGSATVTITNTGTAQVTGVWFKPSGYGFELSSDTISAGDLGASGSTTVSIPFKIMGSTKAGVYVLQVQAYWTTTGTDGGTTYKSFSIPMTVTEPAVFQLSPIDKQTTTKGSSFTLKPTITNTGGKASNVVLTLNSNYFILSGKSRILLGDIPRGGSFTFELPLATSSGTPVGLYSVPVTLTYNDELGAEQNATLSITPVYVASSEPKLVVSVDTGRVEPGEKFDVKITLRNVGTSDANRITLALAISLPFIPIESGNLYIEKLGVGEEKTLSVKMTSDSSTESKTYLIPLSASYSDDSNTHYNISDYVGIDLKGRAKLSISRVKTSPEDLVQGARASLEIRIENYGNGEAKNVRAVLTIDGDSYETIVGKIAAGDRANANFPLERVPSEGKVNVSMRTVFEDSEGWKETTENFQLVVYGGGGGMSALTIFIMLALIAVIAYVFRGRISAMLGTAKRSK